MALSDGLKRRSPVVVLKFHLTPPVITCCLFKCKTVQTLPLCTVVSTREQLNALLATLQPKSGLSQTGFTLARAIWTLTLWLFEKMLRSQTWALSFRGGLNMCLYKQHQWETAVLGYLCVPAHGSLSEGWISLCVFSKVRREKLSFSNVFLMDSLS